MAKVVRLAYFPRARLYLALFALCLLCLVALLRSGSRLADYLRLLGSSGTSGTHVYQETIRKDYIGSPDKPVVIQSFSSSSIPDKYVSSVQSIRAHNPSYHYLFFTDSEMEPFLRQYYPAYLVSFNKLPMFIQKLDYFRYIAVYHYGGFYFDLDMRVTGSLDELLKFDCVFPLEYQVTKHYDSPVVCSYNLRNEEGICNHCKGTGTLPDLCDAASHHLTTNVSLGQYAFYAKPRNAFLEFLVEGIHNSVDMYVEEHRRDASHHYVFKTTGPIYVTRRYQQYSAKGGVTLLPRVQAEDGYMYFGAYAQHAAFGSWKSVGLRWAHGVLMGLLGVQHT